MGYAPGTIYADKVGMIIVTITWGLRWPEMKPMLRTARGSSRAHLHCARRA